MTAARISYDLSERGVAAARKARPGWPQPGREQGGYGQIDDGDLDLFQMFHDGAHVYVLGAEFDAPRTFPQMLNFVRTHRFVADDDGLRWEPR